MFTASDLYYGHIKAQVGGARGINQSPQLQKIKQSGDDAGEYLFRRQPQAGQGARH